MRLHRLLKPTKTSSTHYETRNDDISSRLPATLARPINIHLLLSRIEERLRKNQITFYKCRLTRFDTYLPTYLLYEYLGRIFKTSKEVTQEAQSDPKNLLLHFAKNGIFLFGFRNKVCHNSSF